MHSSLRSGDSRRQKSYSCQSTGSSGYWFMISSDRVTNSVRPVVLVASTRVFSGNRPWRSGELAAGPESSA